MRYLATLSAALLLFACSSNSSTSITVAISPTTAALSVGSTQTFTATVTGSSDTTVNWSVAEAAGGTITSAGLYTAPGAAGTYHVVATSAADSAATATATVLVTAPVVAISISPATASLLTGGTQTFTATVTGADNTAATWSVTEAGGGTITSGGVYSAPATAGTFHVVATSAADPTKSATAVVTVSEVGVTISPATVVVAPGQMQAFTAAVTGTSDTAVTWSVTESAGGAITTGGEYTAPAIAGSYHVVATSVADPSKSSTAVVVVPVVVTVSPSTLTLDPNATHTFTATVAGSANSAVVWSLVESTQGATIDSNGLFTAPGNFGVFHVVATSAADSNASATATVDVSVTFSGTVTYTGTHEGPIYLSLSESYGGGNGNTVGGTTLGGPGPFTIHGASVSGGNNAQLVLTAWMDGTAGQTPLYVSTTDPYVSSPFAYPTTVSVSGITLALVDPLSAVPTVPTQAPDLVLAGDGSALVVFESTSVADHYKVYAMSSSAGSCTNAGTLEAVSSVTVPAWLNQVVFVSGLVNGSSYCFAYSSIANGVESALSPIFNSAPVTIGAATGGVTVSGSITDAQFPNTGVLYVAALIGGQQPVAFARVEQTANPQPYTIEGLSPGTYNLAVVDDPSDLGYISATAATDTNGNNAPTFTVSNTAVTGLDYTLAAAADPVATITSFTYASYASSSPTAALSVPYTSLRADVSGGDSLIYAVTIDSGPGIVPADMGIDTNNNGNGTADWTYQFPNSSTLPANGSTYQFTVYAAATTVASSPQGVFNGAVGIATNTSPSNGDILATATPSFSWGAPSSPPASYTYEVDVYDASNGNQLWQLRNIPSTTTQAVYNSDGKGQTLNDGNYYWQVQVSSADGSASTVQSYFTITL